jgi:hypothetical protein
MSASCTGNAVAVQSFQILRTFWNIVFLRMALFVAIQIKEAHSSSEVNAANGPFGLLARWTMQPSAAGG